jgi:hypothetical protein
VGKGQDVRGKGSASMKMTGKVQSLPDGSTEVASIAEVTVVGLLAQMGGRMIQEVSNKMFAEFTANFAARLQQEKAPTGDSATGPPTTEEAKPIQALPILLSAARESVVGSIRRIFKGSDEP